MTLFKSSLPTFQIRREGDSIYFENKYIQWRHNAVTGMLDGAFVRYGSGTNLLARAASTVILFYDEQKSCPVALKRGRTLRLETACNRIFCSYTLYGEPLGRNEDDNAVIVCHEVTYQPWGAGEHTITIQCQHPVGGLFSVQVLALALSSRFDMLTWRPTLESGVGIWAQNNTPTWRPLYHGKRHDDMQALNCKRIPLSVLAIRRGEEGIEFALGDNLDEWNAFRPAGKNACQEFQFAYEPSSDAYSMFVAPYNLRDDGILGGEHSFHYSLTLPFVREYMAPLRPGAQIPYGPNRGRSFEQRWPQAEELGNMAEAGYELLRVHNDGDCFRNGIFWRDAAYPPYPPLEMEKMEQCLKNAHRYHLKAVPYFSLKEIHPDVADFAKRGEEWARRDEPKGSMRYTRYPGGFWGVQMCLKSQWYHKRMETIREVLANHDFDGIYFDWCMALECFGDSHCPFWHWDAKEFTELLAEVKEICGESGEMYLHTSNVPSLASENLATQLLTEEVAFPAISPEMFTPHVHFLNTAPRQICNMLPANTNSDDLTRLAMCAILHHATVADAAPPFLDFYRQNRSWMNTVQAYRRHHAPGEGWSHTDNEMAGLAYYEKEKEILAVFANLSKDSLIVRWELPKAILSGTITLPPLAITTTLIEKKS